jgi:hypothetical protein
VGKRGYGRRGALFALSLSIALIAVGCGDDDDDDEPSSQPATTAAQETGSVEEFIRADHAKLDSDGDGSLSTEETEASLRAEFARSDADGDGAITLDDIQQELDQGGGGKADQPLAYYVPYDADGDDEIAEDEYVSEGMKQIHAAIDADGDAELTAHEAVEFHLGQAAGGNGK